MGDRGDIERWLGESEISCVRLVGTNHDGLVLGKYLSVPKFISTLDGGSVFADTCFWVDFSGDVAVGWDWGRWRGEVSDIKLVPDPSTLIADPSVEGWASVICDFTDLEDEPLAQGYRDLTPLGGNGRMTYLMSRSRDLGVFVDAVVRRLDGLGIPWEYWSCETAPGQVEINIAPTDPVATADYVTRTKLALREVAEERGHSVTFMAYGIDEHLGGGMHINLSLDCDTGAELEPDRAPGALRRLQRLPDPCGDPRRREVVEYWLGSREWEWLAFHNHGGDQQGRRV